jgi:hypothetical protein
MYGGSEIHRSGKLQGKKEEHGDELTEMYTFKLIGPDGKPNIGPARMTTEQADAVRKARVSAAAAALLAIKPVRPPTPPLAFVPAPVHRRNPERKGRRPATTKGLG